MCVFLCANPQVRQWLSDVTVDYAIRESLQLCPLCGNDPPGTFDEKPAEEIPTAHAVCGREGIRTQLHSARDRFRRARSGMPAARRFRLAQPRHKALDALAEAWHRLLAWVGLWR